MRYASLPLLALVALLSATPARAETVPPQSAAEIRANTQGEFERIQADIRLSEDRVAALKAEVDRLEQDRAKATAELLAATERRTKLESSVSDAETRIFRLESDQEALRTSLYDRRAVLAEILAGIQRVGRKPPPAVLVRPEDALSAVRSAILMGAILPELRDQAQKLAADLDRMAALKDRIVRERDAYRGDLTRLIEERTRLELLMEQRRSAKTDQQRVLDEERRRAQDLASKATSLKDLIARSEKDMETARKAAAAADELRRKIEEGRNQAPPPSPAPAVAAAPPPLENQQPKQDANGKQLAALPKGDRSIPPDITQPALMQPARPFADGRGHMTLPVVGVTLRSFGEDDGSGLNLKGIQISARARGLVTSPADGWVLYAGTFRSYGKLLIINGGGGYHVVLAGMERIDVEIGQFVLAGEPVGEMGERKLPAAQIADIKSGQPVLYVEFRKDGTPIDPAPWWAKNT